MCWPFCRSCRCGDGWSLDRIIRIARGKPAPPHDVPSARYGWARYAVWTVIAVPYVAAGMSKLYYSGFAWLHPDNMKATLLRTTLAPMEFDWTVSIDLLRAPDIVFVGLAAVGLFTELLFGLVLFSRAARRLLPAVDGADARRHPVSAEHSVRRFDPSTGGLLRLHAASPGVGRWTGGAGGIGAGSLRRRLRSMRSNSPYSPGSGRSRSADVGRLQEGGRRGRYIEARARNGGDRPRPRPLRVLAPIAPSHGECPRSGRSLPFLYLPACRPLASRLSPGRGRASGNLPPRSYRAVARPSIEARVHRRGATRALRSRRFCCRGGSPTSSSIPFTTMKMFAAMNEPLGTISYITPLAIREDGTVAPARFERWIGAMADARYRRIISRRSSDRTEARPHERLPRGLVACGESPGPRRPPRHRIRAPAVGMGFRRVTSQYDHGLMVATYRYRPTGDRMTRVRAVGPLRVACSRVPCTRFIGTAGSNGTFTISFGAFWPRCSCHVNHPAPQGQTFFRRTGGRPADAAADAVFRHPQLTLIPVPYMTFPLQTGAGRRYSTAAPRIPMFGMRAGRAAARLVASGDIDLVHGLGASVLGYAPGQR